MTDTALRSSSSVLDGTSSTMGGGAVGPSSSCVHHAEVSGSARTARDTGSGAVRRRGCLGDERRVVWARCCAFSSVASSIAASESESEWSCSCVWGVSAQRKVGVMRSGREGLAQRRYSAEGPAPRGPFQRRSASRNPRRVGWGSERGALIRLETAGRATVPSPGSPTERGVYEP